MSKITQFCARISNIRKSLADDSAENCEQTIKGLLVQYGLGEVSSVRQSFISLDQIKRDNIVLKDCWVDGCQNAKTIHLKFGVQSFSIANYQDTEEEAAFMVDMLAKALQSFYMQSNFNAAAEPANETSEDVVLRCLGVGENANKTAYFVDDEWIYVSNEKKFFGDAKFKNVLCLSCQKHEREKQLTK